jgi:hypothetical protein
MDFVTHSLVGAALMLALFHPVLFSGLFWTLCIYGLITGSLWDTLEFTLPVEKRLFFRDWAHNSRTGLFTSIILIAPLPHYLGDKLVHAPIIPEKGTSAFMDEMLVQHPKLARRDILWLTGELMMIFFLIILIGVYFI